MDTNTNTQSIKPTKKSMLGQGMTEYIIIVALIAVAAIGVTSMFGQSIRINVNAMIDELTGKSAKTTLAKGKELQTKADTLAGKKTNMGNYNETATDGI